MSEHVDNLIRMLEYSQGCYRDELLGEIFRVYKGAKGIAEELKANTDTLPKGHTQRVRLILAITDFALKTAEGHKESHDPEEIGQQIIQAMKQLSPEGRKALSELMPGGNSHA